MQPATKKSHTEQIAAQISVSRLVNSAHVSILQQLVMSLHWDPMPEGLMAQDGSINATYPRQKAWDSLSLMEKIGALFRAHGFQSCCTALPSLGNVSEDLEKYQMRVHALTNGVVTAPQLSHYAVLRTLLLADMEKRMDSNKDCVKLYRELEVLFTSLDQAIQDPERMDVLKSMAPRVQGCMTYLQNHSCNPPLSKPIQNRLDRAIVMLDLIRMAVEDPLHFVPILLSPVQAQCAELASKRIDLQLCENLNMDPRAADWLDDFYQVFKLRFLTCQSQLERPQDQKQRDLYNAISSIQHEIFHQAETFNKELLGAMREVHRFQGLSRVDQREKQKMEEFQALIAKVARFQGLFIEHHDKVGEWKLKVKEYVEPFPHSPFSDLTLKQLLEYPWRFYAGLLAGITASLTNQPTFMQANNRQLDVLLPAPYNAIDTPYATGIDLLDCCFRTAYFAFRQKIANGTVCKTLDGNQKRALLGHLDGLMATCVSTFKRPRAFLATKGHGILNYEEKKGSYELMEVCLSRKTEWEGLKKGSLLDAKAKKNIDYFSTYFANLALLFTINSWPALLRLGSSSKVTGGNSLEKETAFFCECFSNIRRSVLHHDLYMISGYLNELLSRPWLKGAQKVSESLKLCTTEIFEAIQDFQKQALSQPEPALENFQPEVGIFLTRLADFLQSHEERCARIAQILTVHIDDHPEVFKDAEKFLYDVNALFVFWDALFISPSRPLIRYHVMLSILAEQPQQPVKEKDKTEVEPSQYSTPKALPAPVLPLKPPEPPAAMVQQLPNDLPGLMTELETVLRSILHLYKGFKVPSDISGAQFSTQFQEGAAIGLLHTLKCLRELSQNIDAYGERPAFSQELHLRIAVLLEQAVKLVASENHVDLSFEEKWPLLLVKIGRQCLWQQHAPERIFKTLQSHMLKKKAAPPCLNDEELAYLKTLERTIAITSRYPAAGSDPLAKLLAGLVKLKTLHPAVRLKVGEKHRENAHQFMKAGIKTTLKLLTGLKQETGTPLDPDPEHVQAALSSIQEDVPPLENAAKRILSSIHGHLEKIRLYRMIPEQRQLVPLSEIEETQGSRKGTIETALQNLQVVANLCLDLLTDSQDPALCLTHCHSVLRQEAVLLEMIQLLLLAQAPLSQPDSNRHLLWVDKFPLRYSHRIDFFAENLPDAFQLLGIETEPGSVEAIQGRSRALTPYLKEFYRYHAEQDLHPVSFQIQKMEILSELWDRFVTGRLTATEERLLDRNLEITNPQHRQEKLRHFIQSTIQRELHQPLLQTLNLVNELLAHYENLLNSPPDNAEYAEQLADIFR